MVSIGIKLMNNGQNFPLMVDAILVIYTRSETKIFSIPLYLKNYYYGYVQCNPVNSIWTSFDGFRLGSVLQCRYYIQTPTQLFHLYTYRLHVVIPSPVSILEVHDGIVVRQNSDGIARGKGMDLGK